MQRKILVADDEQIILHLLDVILKKEGFLVIKASNGGEVLGKVAIAQPEMIFLDIMMPRMDGWETLASLQNNAETETIPVVMLTACTSAEDRQRALDNGATEYIYKPFSPLDIISCVHRVLGKKA
jgi:twitching motility two-component system response regulator PilG